MPASWAQIIEHYHSFTEGYEPQELERFYTHLKVFAWEKCWIGARGLEVTEEMRVIISGIAARLSHNLDLDIYDRLSEVVIYPSHYVHSSRDAIIYGEAHHWGTVVLSWDAVTHGIKDPHDGHDTALHEFAHVIDVADGWFDGTPQLREGKDYKVWASVLGKAYAELKRAPQRGIMRAYGATNEAEFFAVSTEAFFERPQQLLRDDPALYAQLKKFYGADPAAKAKRLGRREAKPSARTPLHYVTKRRRRRR